MEFIGANADFGAHAKLTAVVQPSTGIYHYSGAVDLADKLVDRGFVSGDDWVLAAQAFAGLVFEVTPNFEIYTGLRYLWVDDADVLPANSNGFDDVGIGAGIRFNF